MAVVFSGKDWEGLNGWGGEGNLFSQSRKTEHTLGVWEYRSQFCVWWTKNKKAELKQGKIQCCTLHCDLTVNLRGKNRFES